MNIDFDSAKNASNIEKHGISLGRFIDITDGIVVPDDRFAEPRFRIYGMIDNVPHCAAVAMTNTTVRVINLRRAHRKEYNRYV